MELTDKIRRVYLPMTETGFYILFCLQKEGHGYSITQKVKEMTEDELKAALTDHVREHIGPIAKPKDVVAVADIPKTRSGKITRRLLGELYQGRSLGDVSSLQNEEALGHIAQVLVDTGRVSEAV